MSARACVERNLANVTWNQFVRQLGEAEQALRRLRWLHAAVSLVWLVIVAGLLGFSGTLVMAGQAGAFTTGSLIWWAAAGGLLVGWHAWMAWRHHARMRHDLPDVMRKLGAQPLDTLGNPLERRLQNLLEELALSAHVGVPRAFVIDRMDVIDGLTLGLDRNNTAVVVTRGALTRLTREALRGLLAHEIAHVVNGDVKTTTYLLCMNRGLRRLAALGWAWRAAGAPYTFKRLLGGVCVVLGAPGVAAARLIEAGLPAARDQHADALAVALTGQADALGCALHKIDGETTLYKQADVPGCAPMHADWYDVGLARFSAPRGWSAGCASNLSLIERIALLCGDRAAPSVEPVVGEPISDEPALPTLGLSGESAGAQAGVHGALMRPRRVFLQGPEPALMHGDDAAQESASATAVMRLMRATREPAGAAALAVALMVDIPCAERPAGEQPVWGPLWLVAAQRDRSIHAALGELPEASFQALRWPLLELACGRLRPLSLAARQSLMALARAQAIGDRRFAPRQWIHSVLLQRRLGLAPASARNPGFGDTMDARSVRVLCAILAQEADLGEVKADRAANAAIRDLALPPIGGSPGVLSLDALERAVELAAGLSPIDRLTLIEHLRRLLPAKADPRCAEFLRLLCLTIDCPQVSASSAPDRPVQTELATPPG